jgi:hypothetical protein
MMSLKSGGLPLYNNTIALGERPETGSCAENMLLSQHGSLTSVIVWPLLVTDAQ